MNVSIEKHPSLRVAAFVTRFPRSLGDTQTPERVLARLTLSAEAPVHRDEAVRAAVRDMLRVGGYKPTGRGKPASEYLVRAVSEGALSSINLAVDVCNIVSLHSGLPISVVDLDLAQEPFSIRIAPAGTTYVFNASGQEIDVAGLVCLFDASGACANAVRDSHRTKTRAATTRTLSVIWGAREHEPTLVAADKWYRDELAAHGASTEICGLQES